MGLAVKVGLYPVFSGLKWEHRTTFLEGFKNRAALDGVHLNDAYLILPHLLKRHANLWWTSLPEKVSWDRFEVEFRKEYLSRGYLLEVRRRLNYIYLRDFENADEFIYQLYMQFKELGKELSEADRCEIILLAVPRYMRNFFDSREIRKERELCKRLKELEFLASMPQHVRENVENNSRKINVNSIVYSRVPPRCYFCNSLLHKKRSCKLYKAHCEKRENAMYGSPTGERKGANDAENFREIPQRQEFDGVQNVHGMGNLNEKVYVLARDLDCTQLPGISVIMADKREVCLIDTAASVSLVGEGIANRVGAAWRKLSQPIQIQTLGGIITLEYECTLRFSFQGIEYENNFMVTRGEDHKNLLLVGYGFLKRNSAVIRCNGDQIDLGPPEKKRIDDSQGRFNVFESNEQEEWLRELWEELKVEFADVFNTESPLPALFKPYHIQLKDYTPIQRPQYAVPVRLRDKAREEIDKFLRLGIISRTNAGYWSQPIMMIPKANNAGIRLLGDFRAVNQRIVKLSSTQVPIESAITSITKYRYLSTIDLAHGFYQIPVSPETSKIFSFTIGSQRYCFNRLVQGFSDSPSYFNSCMAELVREAECEGLVNFVDDFCLGTNTVEEHGQQLRRFLAACRKYRVYINPEKCRIAPPQVIFLGQTLSDNYIRIATDKVSALRGYPCPTGVKALKRWIGLVSYYRRFVPNYGNLISPALELLRKGVKWKWSEECQSGFDAIQRILESGPKLKTPTADGQYILQTDASKVAAGACLLLEENGIRYPVAFYSKSFNNCQRNYSTLERECYAIFLSVRHFSQYLMSRRVVVETDHRPLESIFLKEIGKIANNRVRSWLVALLDHDLHVKYVGADCVQAADAMSRLETAPEAAVHLTYVPEGNVVTKRKRRRHRRRQKHNHRLERAERVVIQGSNPIRAATEPVSAKEEREKLLREVYMLTHSACTRAEKTVTSDASSGNGRIDGRINKVENPDNSNISRNEEKLNPGKYSRKDSRNWTIWGAFTTIFESEEEGDGSAQTSLID